MNGWVNCPYCAAVSWNAPPHGEGQPCPLKLSADEAYVSMLDAQRMSYLRSGVAMTGVSEIFGKLTGTDDDS